MKFKTADLIARIDILITERVEAAKTADAKALKDHEQNRSGWLEAHGDAYVKFANTVKEKIRKGRPILASDIPDGVKNRYREFALFSATQPPKPVPARLDDLETLKSALSAVADEYVTTTGLREIGFKDIARLFRANAA